MTEKEYVQASNRKCLYHMWAIGRDLLPAVDSIFLKKDYQTLMRTISELMDRYDDKPEVTEETLPKSKQK